MINQIVNYIKYLKKEHKFNISIHTNENRLQNVINHLTPFNIHANKYCIHIKKSSDKVWQNCCSQQKIVNAKAATGPFFGSCCAGVGEFVFPIMSNDQLLGFISVSGYYGNEEKRDHFAEKYGFDKKELEQLYKKHLNPYIPKYEHVETLISPLISMLVLYSSKEPISNGKTMADYIYSHIISIINSSYAENLSLTSLAAACHCSTSHIAHYFKKKSGITINQYITKVRLKNAKMLLENSNIPISEIAEKTGFSDPNYFSYVFSKAEGISPRVYRQKSKRK